MEKVELFTGYDFCHKWLFKVKTSQNTEFKGFDIISQELDRGYPQPLLSVRCFNGMSIE